MWLFTALVYQLILFHSGSEESIETISWLIPNSHIKVPSSKVRQAYTKSKCCSVKGTCDVSFEDLHLMQQGITNTTIHKFKDNDIEWFSKTLSFPKHCVMFNVQHWYSPYNCAHELFQSETELVGFMYDNTCFTFKINDNTIEYLFKKTLE